MTVCAFLSCPIMAPDKNNNLRPVMQDASRESPALGVYTLSSILKHNDIDCFVVDWVAHSHLTASEIAEKLLGAEVIYFSANSMNWAANCVVAKLCRESDETVKLCVGGPHATHFPESVIGAGIFDAFFRGEADNAIVKITSALTKSKNSHDIPGFAFCFENTIPSINVRSVFGKTEIANVYEDIPYKRFKGLPVETSRGCKFSCSFCSITSKNNWRGMKADISISKLHVAWENIDKVTHGIISIVDDTFTTDHDRIISMMNNLEPSRYYRRLNFDATIVDLRNKKLVESLEYFTNNLLVGAEVATKKDAKNIRKAASPKLLIDAANILKECNLANRSVFSFIIGFPWHTKEDCLNVLEFVKDLISGYDVKVYLQWYWPMPGSEIWKKLREKGKVSLEFCNEPGFFLKKEWFYGIRQLSEDDVREVDEKAQLLKLLMNIATGSEIGSAVEYASPVIRKDEWEAKRFAFMS